MAKNIHINSCTGTGTGTGSCGCEYPRLSAYKGIYATLDALKNKYKNGGQRDWFAFIEDTQTTVYWSVSQNAWKDVRSLNDLTAFRKGMLLLTAEEFLQPDYVAQQEYVIPGSYGVSITDGGILPDVAGESNGTLVVQYASNGGEGAMNSQDYLHTLILPDGRVFTRTGKHAQDEDGIYISWSNFTEVYATKTYVEDNYVRKDSGTATAETLNILFNGINPDTYTVSEETPTNIIVEARASGFINLPILDTEKSLQIQIIGGSFVEINGSQYQSGETVFATLNLDGADEWVISSTNTSEIPTPVTVDNYKDVTVNKIFLNALISQQAPQSDVYILYRSGVEVSINDLVLYYPRAGHSLEHTGLYKVLSKTTAGGLYKVYTQKIASYMALDTVRVPEYMGGLVLRSLYDGGNSSTIGFKVTDCHNLVGYTEISPVAVDTGIGSFKLDEFTLSAGQKILVNNKTANKELNGMWIKLYANAPFSTLVRIANVEFVDSVRIDGVDEAGGVVREVLQSKYIGVDANTKYYEPAGSGSGGSMWEDVEAVQKSVELGYLYNYFVTTDPRKVSSSDEWRVPLESDFIALKATAGTDQGAKLKDTSADYWLDVTGHTNSLKFNARGSGMRDYSGYNFLQHKNRFLIQSSELSGSSVILFMLIAGTGTIGITKINNSPYGGYGLRFVKTSTTLAEGEEGTYTGNDGYVYKTICIGGKEWLAENLIETKYRNGNDIPLLEDNEHWGNLFMAGARCAMNNDEGLAFSGTSSTSDIIAPKGGKKVHAGSIVGLPSRLEEFTSDVDHRTVTDTQISTWNGKPSIEFIEENFVKKTTDKDGILELYFDDRNNVFTTDDILPEIDTVVAKIDLDVTGYITLIKGNGFDRSILIQVVHNGDDTVKLILINDGVETEYSTGTTIFATYTADNDMWVLTSSATVEPEVIPDYSDVSVKKMVTEGGVLTIPGNLKRLYFSGLTGLNTGDLFLYNVGAHYFTGVYRIISGLTADRIVEYTELRTVRVAGDGVYHNQYDGTDAETVSLTKTASAEVVTDNTTIQGNGTVESPISLKETGLNTAGKYFVTAAEKLAIAVNAGNISTLQNLWSNYSGVQKNIKNFTGTIMNLQKDKDFYNMTLSTSSTVTFDTTLLDTGYTWDFHVFFEVSNFISVAFPANVYFYGGNQMTDIGTYLYRFISKDNGLTWTANLVSKKIQYISETGKIIYVKTATDGGNDGNNGLSWDTAKATYEGAQSIAIAGDIIMMKAGTYLPTQFRTSGVDDSKSFILKNQVNVYGGCQGTESSPDERVMQTTQVVLDLPYGVYQYYTKLPQYQTIFSGDLQGNDVLSGATTYGCRYTTASMSDNAKTGVYFTGASLTVLDGVTISSFKENAALSDTQMLRITNSLITDIGSGNGGGTLTNVICSNSVIQFCFTEYSSILVASQGIDCIIKNTRTSNDGLGLVSTFNHCKITSVSMGGGLGYGNVTNLYNCQLDSSVWTYYMSLKGTYVNITIKDCMSTSHAIILNSYSSLVSAKIINNSVSAANQALFELRDYSYSSNILVAHNSSYSASVDATNRDGVVACNYTIVKNLGVTHSGAMGAPLINSVVWGNRIDGLTSNWYGTATPSYCAFENETVSGTSNVIISTNNSGDNTSPKFLNAEDTVGNTVESFDYDIEDTSYLIDKGNNSYPNNGDGSLYDCKGRTRKVRTVDIGAFENQATI